MTPAEAIDEAISLSFVFDRRFSKPGEFMQKIVARSPQRVEAISRLKSDDIANVRAEFVGEHGSNTTSVHSFGWRATR